MERDGSGTDATTSPRRGEVAPKARVRGLDRFRLRARHLRDAETNAEARLWQALRNRQLAHWKFRRQHPVDRYIVDFVTIDRRLVVEVDGATHSTARQIARDTERTRVLESLGFHVVRVTNHEVYDNLPGVLDLIWSELNQRPP